MKKLNGKLIVSMIMAAAVASAASVSAGAIDYYTQYAAVVPSSSSSDTTSSSSDTGSDVAADIDATVTAVTEDEVGKAIEDAIKDGDGEVTIEVATDVTGSAVVQEAAIAEIAKNDVVVTFEVKSDSGEDYAITIDPKLIKDAKAINLAMDIEVGSKSSKTVSDVEIPAGSIIISPAQKGDFGMTLTVTLSAASVAGIDVGNASLYYIADDGTVTKVDSQFTVNKDGSISVSLSHASAYVISTEDLVSADTDIYDDDDDDEFFDDDDDDDDDDDVAATVDYDDDSDKSEDVPVVISGADDDANPGTGVTLALGALAASAAAVVITAKKRK